MRSGIHDYFRYLPVARRAVQWGLYVTGAGCSVVAPGSRFPKIGHPDLYQFTWDKGRVLPEYQIIYLIGGTGTFESGPTGRLSVGAGDVLLLFPGVWHRYRPSVKTGWDSYWVGVNGHYLQGLVHQGFFSPSNPILKVGQADDFLASFRSLLDQVQAEPIGNPLLLAAETLGLLARLAELAPRGPLQPGAADAPLVEDRRVAEAVHFIWNHSHRPMNVGDVVAHVPVTRRSLERRFQRALGRTILDEITRCRLQRVKRLLEETEVPIKRIASIAGFSSAERLIKIFHRLEGMSPGQYRRRHRA
jgi:AraC-like DNA-binding protein